MFDMITSLSTVSFNCRHEWSFVASKIQTDGAPEQLAKKQALAISSEAGVSNIILEMDYTGITAQK
jgi:hypothetical protein